MASPKAARMALYAASAEDLFDTIANTNCHGVPSVAGQVIGGAANNGDWTVAGQLRADDDTNLVQTLKCAFHIPEDSYYYGFLLKRLTADPNGDFGVGDFVALVRGTQTDKEWLLDACALPDPLRSREHPAGGLVPDGFYSIYESMVLFDANSDELGPAPHAIADIVNASGSKLTVIGHSLGAALATYLTYDIALLIKNPAALTGYFIASPNPGDREFVAGFKSSVPAYNVINWMRDIVPKVPPIPYCPLLDVATPGTTQVVDILEANDVLPVAGGGWAPRDNPGCNHHAVCYARMLDPTNQYAVTRSAAYGCGT